MTATAKQVCARVRILLRRMSDSRIEAHACMLVLVSSSFSRSGAVGLHLYNHVNSDALDVLKRLGMCAARLDPQTEPQPPVSPSVAVMAEQPARPPPARKHIADRTADRIAAGPCETSAAALTAQHTSGTYNLLAVAMFKQARPHEIIVPLRTLGCLMLAASWLW